VVSTPAAVSTTKRVTIYSSLPLRGEAAAVSRQILAGERMALSGAAGRIGRLQVRFLSLDDSSPRTGEWDPGITEANAKLVARDPSAIAYLGDYDSGATAVSLPIINGVGILQVSPSSPYVGLTSSLDAGEDEPERFYPTALRTFARVAPGDPSEASAQVALLGALGVHSVYVLSDEDPFDGPLAALFIDDARRAGTAVLGQDSIDVPHVAASFAAEIAKVAEARPEAVFFSGLASAGAASLFAQLHGALPHVPLLASASLARPSFIAHLGEAAAQTLLATPALPNGVYPSSAQRVLREYRRRLAAAPTAYVLYGYEAMSAVLGAVRAAGSRGGERRTVIERFFAAGRRESVLGTYSIGASGESTLSRYGIERVKQGKAVFWRAFSG
jgi:branched-chain amino acid transport system substrate-binding protein